MTTFQRQSFSHRLDFGGAIFGNHTFDSCEFIGSTFSFGPSLQERSYASNIQFVDCAAIGCTVGPGILEDISVKGLSTPSSLLICFSPFLRRVCFSGKNGSIRFNSEHRIPFSDFDWEAQRKFESDRHEFYSHTDWALDISDAEFSDLGLRGVPAHLVRIDSSRQFIVTRERAVHEAWRSKLHYADDHALFLIDNFLRYGGQDEIIVAPRYKSKERRDKLMNSLKELRDLGVLV